MENFITAHLEDKEKEIEFKYWLQKYSNIVLVEMASPETTSKEIELTASYICRENNISPIKLVYFVEENKEWQMIQFTEFYNERCRIYSKEPVSLQEIQHISTKENEAL